MGQNICFQHLLSLCDGKVKAVLKAKRVQPGISKVCLYIAHLLSCK